MLQKLSYFLFIFLFFILTLVFLWVSDLFLSVWNKLLLQPQWFFWAYLIAFTLFICFSVIMLYRLFPKSFLSTKTTQNTNKEKAKVTELDISKVETRVNQLNQDNIDTQSITDELSQLKKDQTKKDIKIVLFGDISTGKSSLVKALLNQQDLSQVTLGEQSLSHQGIADAEIDIGVIGGTTQQVIHYKWTSPLGESIYITDTPGFNEQNGRLDDLSKKSVYQSHLAIYLCEGDLTSSQFKQIEEIALLDKPIIVAFTKTDRYSESEVELIVEKVQQTLLGINNLKTKIHLVKITTGGTKEVTLLYPDGSEKIEQHQLPIELLPLLKKISTILSKTSQTELEVIRQKSVLHLLSADIDRVEQEAQKQQTKQIIKSSTKKAVIASMATITPGSDLLVQSYLAIAMIKDLCKVYNVPAKEVDINKLLTLLQHDTIGIFPLLLGIAGNGFKAFPGPGTLAGGVLHSVAYGLIFDSVGKAVSLSLSSQGDLVPILVEDIYKEKLVENIESRALELVKMVIKSKTDSKQK